MTAIANKYDFVLFFDVQDGNPNGDPDAGNLPRMDPETGHGLVTDVCLKRKVRNFVLLEKEGGGGYDIFVKEKGILNVEIDRAYTAAGLDPAEAKKAEDKNDRSPRRRAQVETARQKMCEMFFDIRCFGAVLSTGANAGQVRGPVQLTFSRSLDPVVQLEHSVTRVAVTDEEDASRKVSEMGRKSSIPYGLYRCHGFVSAPLARQTGFSQDDLDLLWRAVEGMFEHDRSAARGLMNMRRLIVFKHESELGNAPASVLFDLVTAARKDTGRPPRSFADYDVQLPSLEALPKGVTMELRPSV
jgi:CRISPR-associated protein Csd2